MRPEHKIDASALALIGALCILVLGPQLASGLVHCCLREDTVYYLNWMRQFTASLADGTPYPRWLPDSHGGYGNPTFVFYPPLVMYLTAAFKAATGSTALSITLVKLSGLILSGWAIYLLARELWGWRAGLFAAVFYAALPFRIFDLYFLGVYQSKFAYVWYPLILYFALRAVRDEKSWRAVAGLAVSYALLVLTHLLSAYMFAPVVAAFGIAAAGKGGRLKGAWTAGAGLAIGLMLAAFFLLPVVMQGGEVHLESFAQKAWGRYENNFLFYVLGQRPPSNPPFYPYLALMVTVSLFAGLAAYLPAVGRGAWSAPHHAFFPMLAALCLLLMASVSAPVWEHLPGLGMVAFPTRWASVMALALSCAAGYGLGRLDVRADNAPALRRYASPAILICALVVSAYYDHQIITRSCANAPEYFTALPGYSETTDVEEYVPRGVSLEWLRDMKNRPPAPKVSVPEGGGPATIEIRTWDAEERLFSVKAVGPARLRVRTFWFPGWKAYVDGREARLEVEPESGAMLLGVPGGEHEARLEFTPRYRGAGWAVSALSFAAVVALYLAGRRRRV